MRQEKSGIRIEAMRVIDEISGEKERENGMGGSG